MNTNDLNAALFNRWNVSAVTDLATNGVHYGRAPQGTSYPYSIFQMIPPSKADYTFGETEPCEEEFIYMAKGLAVDTEEKSGPELARDIAAAMDAQVNNVAFTIANQTLLSIYRKSDIEYIEPAKGFDVYHYGGIYVVSIGQE